MNQQRSSGKAGTVEFADNYLPLITKLEKVSQKTPQEIDAARQRKEEVEDAWFGIDWEKIKSPSTYLKFPANTTYQDNEIVLALWAESYAKKANIQFSEALNRIVEYLKAHPTDINQYLLNGNNEGASFSESRPCIVTFTNTALSSPDLGTALHVMKLHSYQIGTGCNFAEAVSALSK
jgi:hypothetical protein